MPPLRLFGNAAFPFSRRPQPATGSCLIPPMASSPSRVNCRLAGTRAIGQRYFFSDLLARLYLIGAVEKLPHPARYGNESSSLRPLVVLLPFLFRHLRTTIRRLFLPTLRGFYPASIELLLGSILMVTGLVFASWNWPPPSTPASPAPAAPWSSPAQHWSSPLSVTGVSQL